MTDSIMAQLGVTFSASNPERWWFVGWAILPILLLGASLFYCTPLARIRVCAITVSVAAFITTMYCLAFVPGLGVPLLVPFGLSVWWAYGA
jgi:hypothetical protein